MTKEINDSDMKTRPIFGAVGFMQKPDLAAKITHVIGTWALIDALYAHSFVYLLGSDIDIAEAMYRAVPEGAQRRKLFLKAAEARFAATKIFQEIRSVEEETRTSRQERNAFAHSLWAYVQEYPTGLVMFDPRSMLAFTFDTRRFEQHSHRMATVGSPSLDEALSVSPQLSPSLLWEDVDFNSACINADKALGLVGHMATTITNSTPENEARRRLLSAFDEVKPSVTL